MRKYVPFLVILFAAAVCLPSAGSAMNSGAHIYVTEQVFGSDDPDLLYGSVAPDLSLYVDPPALWETGFDDTHYDYIVLWPQGWTEPWKRFTLGWMIHNEDWGADHPSHIEYPLGSGPNEGYVNQRAAFLVPAILPYIDSSLPDEVRLALAKEIAHNAIEFAVDVLIQQALDPDLGSNLFEAAMYRSEEDVQRLFNILVARGKVTDRETLFQSEQLFRAIILGYSSALASSSLDSFPDSLAPLALFGVQMAYDLYGVSIPPADVLSLLWYSVDLCDDDFAPFVFSTIEAIKAELGMD